MQLHVFFCGRMDLPMAYRHSIQSMLYDALGADPAYAAALHDGGESPEGRQFKLFTFGQLEGSYRANAGRILFPRGAGLEIRSISDELLWRLFRRLVIGSEVRIGSNRVTIGECAFRNAVIRRDTIDIVTASPIVAYITEDSGRTRFYSPEESQFYSLVAANARRKWQMYQGGNHSPAFSLTPAEDPKFRKQVTTYKTTRITAWHGAFRLSGDPELLNLLYHIGLGAKSSQGFGMFSCRDSSRDF